MTTNKIFTHQQRYWMLWKPILEGKQRNSEQYSTALGAFSGAQIDKKSTGRASSMRTFARGAREASRRRVFKGVLAD